MVTADSASAANGLKARAVAKSRVEGRIMVFVPDVYPLTYRGEFGLWLHTNGTRLRDPAKWSGVRRHPGRDYNLPATFLLKPEMSSWQLTCCSGNIRPKRSRALAPSAPKTQKLLFKKHGGELRAAYATLGGVDLVMIADLPDNARAFAASAALAKSTGIAFTTAPAVTIDEFDKLAG